MSSLLTVPFDVLVECVLKHLPVCALIACHMVCKGLHKAAKKALENVTHTFVAQTKPFLVSCKQQEVILSSFEHGTEAFLYWIETTMKFPLFANEPVPSWDCAERIVIRGDIGMLEYFWNTIRSRHQGQIDYWLYDRWYFICAAAAQHGHLHVIQWAHNNRLLRSQYDSESYYSTLPIVSRAASAGHLHILEWLHSNDFPVSMVKAAKRAAATGHIAVVEWAYKRVSDHISDLKYGNMTSVDVSEIICVSSCGANDTKTLEWALSKGFEFTAEQCLAQALRKGNVRMAEYIRTFAADMFSPPNLIPEYNCMLIDYAIQGNSVETLQWLHDQVPVGYFQSRDTIGSVALLAAETASLEVLQWVLANGYDLDPNAIHSDIVHIQTQNLRWMLQDGRFSAYVLSHKKEFSDLSFLGDDLTLDTVQTLADYGLATPTQETLDKCKKFQTTLAKNAWMCQRIGHEEMSREVPFVFLIK